MLAQFIAHDDFEPVRIEGDLSRENLDADYVSQRESLVSRGYTRLREIAATEGDRDVTAYPLPEAIKKYKA